MCGRNLDTGEYFYLLGDFVVVNQTDGLKAIRKLGNSLKDRASRDLEPVANPVGYFHKIL